ncbi:MAG TPA: hypothetical protein VI911_10655 [Patescibacteria group bacterium]|nr:hypothetical protein [Patescibacteria group bacterium]
MKPHLKILKFLFPKAWKEATYKEIRDTKRFVLRLKELGAPSSFMDRWEKHIKTLENEVKELR